MNTPLLNIRDLRVQYRGVGSVITAVDAVDLQVREGQRVGLVGESGSGKSTLALAVMRLLRSADTAGRIEFGGRDLLSLDEAACNKIRGASIAMVYQDPFTFLNPLIQVGNQVAEAILVHAGGARSHARAEAVAMLERLGLRPGAAVARRYPHQLSGGQRQRVVIGMALIGSPKLLIADEPTTALDVTVQAQVLRVLSSLVAELGTALLLISHDLSVVRLMSEFVYVMYAGRIVELGPTAKVFSAPRHPYTRSLLRASEREIDASRRFFSIPGAPPDLRHPPEGCRFAHRCPHRMDVCSMAPHLSAVDGSPVHAACWLDANL